RLRRESGDNRFWSAILTPALKHPLISAVGAAAVLIVMALPALHIHPAQAGLDSRPKGVATVSTIDKLQKSFPGSADPALVAIKANTDAPATIKAIDELRTQALASGQMKGPIDFDINSSHTVARVAIPLKGNGTDATSNAALKTLRDQILPATVGKLPEARYAVTGGTAASADANALLKRSWPLVFGFVLTFAFLLLLISFRSIVIAAKAIVLNLLSVGAAYGFMILAFQKGWASGLLGFTANGGIANWLPIFMFVILFGLSMDYHVFILSRVREAYDPGMKTEAAVEHGIKSTAGVVSSAALVMVGVFAIFATLPILDMEAMGMGLRAGVLVHASML